MFYLGVKFTPLLAALNALFQCLLARNDEAIEYPVNVDRFTAPLDNLITELQYKNTAPVRCLKSLHCTSN